MKEQNVEIGCTYQHNGSDYRVASKHSDYAYGRYADQTKGERGWAYVAYTELEPIKKGTKP